MTDYAPRQPVVQVKPSWSAPWKTVHWLYCRAATQTVAPTVPSASFLYRHGTITRGGTTREVPPLDDLRGQFVRVLDDASRSVLFLGVFVADAELPHGPDTGAGDQGPEARGIEHVLVRTNVDGCFAAIGSGRQSVHKLDTALPFNYRGAAGRLIGNRSAERHGASYVFADDGEIWTAAQAAQYVVERFAPPAFGLKLIGETANLERVVDAWPAPATVYGGLRRLIDRRRGSCWRLNVAADPPTVEVSSVFAPEDLPAGSPLAPAGVRADLTLNDATGISGVEVRGEQGHGYDELVVRGGHVVVCGTLGLAFDRDRRDKLTPAWDQRLFFPYIRLAGEVLTDNFGLPRETQGQANDRARRKPPWRDVFTRFQITGSAMARGPVVDDEGRIAFDDVPVARRGKRFLDAIPQPPEPPTVAPPTVAPPIWQPAEPYRAPIAVAIDPTTGLYYPNDLSPRPDDPLAPPAFHLEIMTDRMGVSFRVPTPHLLAKGTWPAAGSSDTDVPPAVDFETILCTLAWPADQRLAVRRTLRSGGAAQETPRRLTIDVPAAGAEVLLADTVVALEDGLPVRVSRDRVVRTDRDKLAAIADLAAAWYARDRRVARFTLPWIAGEKDMRRPGILVTQLTAGSRTWELGSVLTLIRYDFQALTTTVATDFAELDFARIASGPTVADGSGGLSAALPSATPTAGLGRDAGQVIHQSGRIVTPAAPILTPAIRCGVAVAAWDAAGERWTEYTAGAGFAAILEVIPTDCLGSASGAARVYIRCPAAPTAETAVGGESVPYLHTGVRHVAFESTVVYWHRCPQAPATVGDETVAVDGIEAGWLRGLADTAEVIHVSKIVDVNIPAGDEDEHAFPLDTLHDWTGRHLRWSAVFHDGAPGDAKFIWSVPSPVAYVKQAAVVADADIQVTLPSFLQVGAGHNLGAWLSVDGDYGGRLALNVDSAGDARTQIWILASATARRDDSEPDITAPTDP